MNTCSIYLYNKLPLNQIDERPSQEAYYPNVTIIGMINVFLEADSVPKCNSFLTH